MGLRVNGAMGKALVRHNLVGCHGIANPSRSAQQVSNRNNCDGDPIQRRLPAETDHLPNSHLKKTSGPNIAPLVRSIDVSHYSRRLYVPLLTWIKRLLPLPGATKMPKARNPVRIEYGHMIRTIKSLEKLLQSKYIHESTRRHATEVKEVLERELEALQSGET